MNLAQYALATVFAGIVGNVFFGPLPSFLPSELTISYIIDLESTRIGSSNETTITRWTGELGTQKYTRYIDFLGPQDRGPEKVDRMFIPSTTAETRPDQSVRDVFIIPFVRPNGDNCTLKIDEYRGLLECPGFQQNARVPGIVVLVKVVRTAKNTITILAATSKEELDRMMPNSSG